MERHAGVKKRDAQIQCFMDYRARRFGVDAQAKVIAAETHGGNCQCGAANLSLLHDVKRLMNALSRGTRSACPRARA